MNARTTANSLYVGYDAKGNVSSYCVQLCVYMKENTIYEIVLKKCQPILKPTFKHTQYNRWEIQWTESNQIKSKHLLTSKMILLSKTEKFYIQMHVWCHYMHYINQGSKYVIFYNNFNELWLKVQTNITIIQLKEWQVHYNQIYGKINRTNIVVNCMFKYNFEWCWKC